MRFLTSNVDDDAGLRSRDPVRQLRIPAQSRVKVRPAKGAKLADLVRTPDEEVAQEGAV